MDRDPKALPRPVRRHVHMVVDAKARMFDAVPDQFGHQHLGILQNVRRDRELLEGTPDLCERSRVGADVDVQTPSRLSRR